MGDLDRPSVGCRLISWQTLISAVPRSWLVWPRPATRAIPSPLLSRTRDSFRTESARTAALPLRHELRTDLQTIIRGNVPRNSVSAKAFLGQEETHIRIVLVVRIPAEYFYH